MYLFCVSFCFSYVPEKIKFDNGNVAVKVGLGVHVRKHREYMALSAHYVFDALFCDTVQGHDSCNKAVFI